MDEFTETLKHFRYLLGSPERNQMPLAPGINSPALWDTSSLPVHMELHKDPISSTTAKYST